MQFSVCIDAVFGRNTDPASAIRKVREIGFDAYEFWSWWDKDIENMKKAQLEAGLTPAALCTKFISLTDPDRRKDYLEGLKETIKAAGYLGCKTIISQVGAALPGVDRSRQHESIVNGLKVCAPYLEEAGMTLVIEPLNIAVDHPDYYLSTSAEAAEILEETDKPSVKMLFDVYHQQITEGDLIRNIQRYIPLIGHFHAAGNPGRDTILKGEINYPAVLEAIWETAYQGFVGLEYFPSPDKAESSLTEILNSVMKAAASPGPS